jgi:TM2 domain-containing membrane protein YozV
MMAPAYPYAQPSYAYAPYAMRPQCSRAEYVLLGLFLGIFGVHNFVAGRTGAGFVQLLITVLTGWLILPLLFVMFWVFIELIVVDTDSNGRMMS